MAGDGRGSGLSRRLAGAAAGAAIPRLASATRRSASAAGDGAIDDEAKKESLRRFMMSNDIGQKRGGGLGAAGEAGAVSGGTAKSVAVRGGGLSLRISQVSEIRCLVALYAVGKCRGRPHKRSGALPPTSRPPPPPPPSTLASGTPMER